MSVSKYTYWFHKDLIIFLTKNERSGPMRWSWASFIQTLPRFDVLYRTVLAKALSQKNEKEKKSGYSVLFDFAKESKKTSSKKKFMQWKSVCFIFMTHEFRFFLPFSYFTHTKFLFLTITFFNNLILSSSLYHHYHHETLPSFK